MNNIPDALQKQMLLASWPLRLLSSGSSPIGSATGCIIGYKGKTLLLTVLHIMKNPGTWAIELEIDAVNRRTKLYQIDTLNSITFGNAGTDLDFAYTPVTDDIVALYQKLDVRNQVINYGQRTILKVDFNLKPDVSQMYGFAGQTIWGRDHQYLYPEEKIIPGMKFMRQENEYYIFKLPVEHPGHDFFKGCSGAPIFDYQGRAVALVCQGNENDDTIYGIAIDQFRFVFDLEASGSPGNQTTMDLVATVPGRKRYA